MWKPQSLETLCRKLAFSCYLAPVSECRNNTNHCSVTICNPNIMCLKHVCEVVTEAQSVLQDTVPSKWFWSPHFKIKMLHNVALKDGADLFCKTAIRTKVYRVSLIPRFFSNWCWSHPVVFYRIVRSWEVEVENLMQTVILLLLLLLLPLCIVCDAVTMLRKTRAKEGRKDETTKNKQIHAMKDSNERRKENWFRAK